jgi:hypothetical protein
MNLSLSLSLSLSFSCFGSEDYMSNAPQPPNETNMSYGEPYLDNQPHLDLENLEPHLIFVYALFGKVAKFSIHTLLHQLASVFGRHLTFMKNPLV